MPARPLRLARPARAVLAAVGLVLLVAPPAAAQEAPGAAQNFGGLQLDGDQPISIESGDLEVNEQQAQAVFTGNVQVVQGETELRTSRLVVHYSQEGGSEGGSSGAMPGGSNQIERLEASGSVYVRSADQVATAETASFDMGTQLIVMNGDVVLTQGDNVAEGCRLEVQADTGVARLQSNCGGTGSGRVRMMLTPGQGSGN